MGNQMVIREIWVLFLCLLIISYTLFPLSKVISLIAFIALIILNNFW
jgi:hypothetical protein